MQQPTIIQGPAIVTFNGATYYVKGGIQETYTRATFAVESDNHGVIDNRVQSDRWEISFRPVGMIVDLTKPWQYGPADVGLSIFGTSDKPLVIKTLDGTVITYNKAAITRQPVLSCKPTDTLHGDMTFVCIGDGVRTDADHFRGITSADFTDTTFDETKIKTAIYDGAWGASPYSTIGSMEGFEFEQTIALSEVTADDKGVADIILQGIEGKARFRPSNLTQIQIDTMFKSQGTGALAPGESVAKADTDLVVTSSALNVTLHKCGPVSTSARYAVGEHRLGVIEFAAKRTWSSGVADPLFTIAIQ